MGQAFGDDVLATAILDRLLHTSSRSADQLPTRDRAPFTQPGYVMMLPSKTGTSGRTKIDPSGNTRTPEGQQS